MAITLIAKPHAFSPAYNPMKFIYDSTNKNEDGFRYVFDIYETGGSKIAEFKVLPRITDGYGEKDLSKFLQNYVNSTFIPTNANQVADSDYTYSFDVKIGEEYVTIIDWTADLTQDGIYTEITATHAFQIGDRVAVDGGVDNPNLTGLYTVLDINTTVSFTISALWTLVDDATGNGSVRYSDNRKTIVRDIRTDASNVVYDGAFSFADWINYTPATYILDSATDKFLTSMPSTFTITPTQDIWMQLGNYNVTTGFVVFTNSNGDVFRYALTNNDFTTHCKVAGTMTLTTVSGTAPLIKSDTTHYDVYFNDGALPADSQTYRFNIDNRCAIESYEIVFKDRLGSWGSFAFNLRSYTRGNVQKQTYNRDITGFVSSTRWQNYTYEKGQTSISPVLDESIELNTNWMTTSEARYFAELVTSTETYIKIGTDYFSCVVNDTSYDLDRDANKKLIRKIISVKLSNQTPVNG